MDEIKPVWRENFQVRAYEAGPSGLASLPALCDWLQEAAGNHAHHLGWAIDTLQGGGLTWVLSRLHVAVTRMPAWRENITVETWPKGAARAFAVREFRVGDESGVAIVIATSGWLLLDLATRRPVRPPEAIAVLGGQTPARVLDDPFAKLSELSGIPGAVALHPGEVSSVPLPRRDGVGAPERECSVRFADLDMNGHANNVAIVRLLLEGLPEAVLRERHPVALEVEFRAEAMAGDRLVARAEADPEHPGEFTHRLERPAGGREIARGRSIWSG